MKNALISLVVGLLFLAGGFGVGFILMPKPKPVPVVVAPPTTVQPPGAAVAIPAPQAITMDALTKTSESMMELNLALADREKRVAEGEARLKQEEDEMAGERAALDASHEKFKQMFHDFQSRLQLVEASQQEALQRQAELYAAMGPEQSIELIRTMDDATVTKLFSIMDTKPLAKVVAAWKEKYPQDTPRLLQMLGNTGNVIDKDKIALTDASGLAPDAAPEPAPVPVAPPAPDASAPATPAPSSDPTAPATPAPDSPTPNSPAPLAPPPDATAPKAPAQTSSPATTDAVEPDATTPGATAEALQGHDLATIPIAPPASPTELDNNTPRPAPRALPLNVTATTSN